MGARLLTTIGDQGASTRDVYSPIEFSLGLDKGALESYIPAIRKIHETTARVAHGGGTRMLREAIREIQSSNENSIQRHHQLAASRVQMRRLDHWLGQVEAMLEQDRKTVPEPLVSEIAEFVQDIDPRLRRDLVRNRGRSATRVLDVLFDAQEQLMPRTVTRRGGLVTAPMVRPLYRNSRA
jgi:hypothetical protein